MAGREHVWEALKEVLDPEYPVSVVDLGLVRAVEVDGATVRVQIAFTSLGCPCTEIIGEDIRRRLLQLEGVEQVEVEEVFEPWDGSFISPEGRRRLREVGVV